MTDEINNRLDFEEHIKGMSDRQLQEFNVRLTWSQGESIGKLCEEMETKASKNLVAGVLTALGLIVTGMIVYVMKHIGFPQ